MTVSLSKIFIRRRNFAYGLLFLAVTLNKAVFRAKISAGGSIEIWRFFKLKKDKIPLIAITLSRKDNIKNKRLLPVFTAPNPIRRVMPVYIHPVFVIFTEVWRYFLRLIISPLL
ncbi:MULTISPECIES: hypothetical protein [Thermodesulfovibrio]|uniref:hypothetical protein n=1 Tax=Thermodesulfovibrio TaxID=28261 RepID=UPI00260C0057|nr:hypothetical protein [Thermodesulfovibrio sp.]